MILYFHGFDSRSPGNHEKMRQLKFVDPDVRLISYSTEHPKYDMQQLLHDVARALEGQDKDQTLALGVGLGAFWAERIGFLSGIRSVLINPNLAPEHNMAGRIARPEEYADIAAKCVTDFRRKNAGRSLCILSRRDEVRDNADAEAQLSPYYRVLWDEEQGHKFPSLGRYLPVIAAFARGQSETVLKDEPV
ncbi:alpha/beta hydrolase YcfP [Shewanella sp. JM162201]|uniref:Alpha/beta hydrolase YcfP n=1 Tax=Shewanella jiangmenensis TaxID=2837387 RepID=A0ABS5UYC1_9GAMM|nr:alpha/beta hydrolase YcfP [Shewanella jiangmenensis]MBT1443097.1 alpha/beta hydrolase YcfP [Shewanella jiangmenensis]